MFLGGANPIDAELRAPSLKGALRFWWRALNPNNLSSEEKILGSTDEKIGRSKVSLSLKGNAEPILPAFDSRMGKTIQVSSKGRSFPINILDYLAYGCHEYIRGQGLKYVRKCIEPGINFQLTVKFSDDNIQDSVLDALAALSCFGGLGARSRNGYGKFWIERLEDRYKTVKTKLMLGTLQPFTSGSSEGRLFQTTDLFNTWDKALGEIGYAYRVARTSLENRHNFSKRVLVSQPIIENKYNVPEMFLERHAKSIFISVVPENGKYRGRILVLPYDYLADSGNSDLIPARVTKLRTNYQKAYSQVHNSLITHFGQTLNPVL
jgi:CRISPR-associated protein Cmr1